MYVYVFVYTLVYIYTNKISTAYKCMEAVLGYFKKLFVLFLFMYMCLMVYDIYVQLPTKPRRECQIPWH